MRKFFYLAGVLAFVLVVNTAMAKKHMSGNEQTNMGNALKNKNGAYFQNITWDAFSRANAHMKMTYIVTNCSGNYDCIPALVGGFRNKDAKVRTAIYREISYLGYTKDGFSRTKNGAQYKGMLENQVAANERTERDGGARQALMQVKNIFAVTVPDAVKKNDVRGLATMDPQVFIRTNTGAKMTFISMEMQGSRGIQTFNLCLDAATFRGGNVGTQIYIANELKQGAYIFPPKVKKGLAVRVKQKLGQVTDRNIKNTLSDLANKLESGK